MPSSLRHSSTTAWRFASVMSKSGETAEARSRNSFTAS
jgi:hypothetical protein